MFELRFIKSIISVRWSTVVDVKHSENIVSHLLMAAKHTKIWNSSIREASKLYCVPYSTLSHCCQRSETISFDTSIRKLGRASVFSRAQETADVYLSHDSISETGSTNCLRT